MVDAVVAVDVRCFSSCNPRLHFFQAIAGAGIHRSRPSQELFTPAIVGPQSSTAGTTCVHCHDGNSKYDAAQISGRAKLIIMRKVCTKKSAVLLKPSQ
jgi:hypothetical protein